MTSDNPPTVPLDAVQPGARLAAALLGADGQVLMTAGSLLTEAALQRLARRGVLAVAVEPQHDEAELTAAREALRLRLAHLFRRCPQEGDSAAQAVFNAVLEYRLETLR